MTDEIWKDVVGYVGHYQVSNLGRVRSIDKFVRTAHQTVELRKGRSLSKSVDSKGAGYVFANLSKFGKAKKFNVHVLVLDAFVGQRPKGMQGCHNNGDRTDPRLENLRWDTCKANAGDKKLHGTHRTGEKSPAAILTAKQVAEIKESAISSIKLAPVYGVASSTIRAIRTGTNWAQS